MAPKNLICRALLVGFLVVSAAQPAQAGFVTTEQARSLASRDQLVSQVEVKLAEAQAQQALLALGVSPDQVEARLAALSDAELMQLSARLDEMPAGAGVIEVVGVVFVVLIILELVGVTDVFTAL